MTAPPKERAPDSTLAFRRDPYRFVSTRCDRHGTDIFQARLLMQPTICIRGSEAARLFYDRALFSRHGAMPRRIRNVLFGKGGVQVLDGDRHRHRKKMHMALMGGDRLVKLDAIFLRELRDCLPVWTRSDRVRMREPLEQALAKSVLDWAGIRVSDADVTALRQQMTDLFDKAGSIGPPHLQARLSRRRIDRWAATQIDMARDGIVRPHSDTALAIVSNWRELTGEHLPLEVAAVELLNVLRPTVAVGVWLVFVLHALHVHGERPQSAEERRAFILEVRRHYPFFPGVLARTMRAFEWNGWSFPAGRRVVLDIYGTNRDPRLWEAPDEFRPERFVGRQPGPFEIIPQGGGDPVLNHRCPGEWITERLMGVALGVFLDEVAYDVPEQDLTLDYRALPAVPRDGMVLANLRYRN